MKMVERGVGFVRPIVTFGNAKRAATTVYHGAVR
jgi:hypothetical protein